MHSIKLDISDNVFDNVMFFLNNIPKKELKVAEIKNYKVKNNQNSIIDFFQTSPLCDNISLERNNEIYGDRIEF